MNATTQILALLITFLLSVDRASAFGINPSRTTKTSATVNRRDALLPLVTIGLSVPFSAPAQAASDLSKYEDGPRGLKYLVTTEPSGTFTPERAQAVRVSYTLTLNGFLEDGGKKVDSSNGVFGDKPIEFNAGIGMVIKGWDLSLMEMKEGEARRVVVPSELGYGDIGDEVIPGGATLYFEMKLVDIGKVPLLTKDQRKFLEENPL